MAVLCREFGISRKTGYKILNRYKDYGIRGLEDRARSPYRHANKLPFQIETAILRIKQDYPSWGAPKVRDKLIREYPMIRPPAKSTVHAVLDRHGLVKRRRRRRHKAQGTVLSDARAPNALWCADYKGQFRLGINIERIQPGHPQQNGRHERLHLTLKKEATKPPSYNFLQQQERFEAFIDVYNHDRPHQALGGRYPAEVYTPSVREFRHPDAPQYPFHERTIKVTQCGRICIGRRKINLSTVFAGQYVGIREVADQIWLVSFMEYDLGFFDQDDNRVEPVGHNPFNSKVLPMSPV
jgi:hypothetical protein